MYYIYTHDSCFSLSLYIYIYTHISMNILYTLHLNIYVKQTYKRLNKQVHKQTP